MRILVLGDIFGKPGRNIVGQHLPALRQEYGADLVVANVENATHGKGISPEHWQFLKSAGVDVATSGNHVFLREAVLEIWKNKAEPLVRPANYLMGTPGTGAAVWEQAGQKVLVINLIGQVFMKDEVENPFHVIDRLLNYWQKESFAAIVVDFHAEATSEKMALKHYLDGRVQVLFGTHTHVPTADLTVTPQGLGYISDVGMVGPQDSVIGVDKQVIIESFLSGENRRHAIPEGGPMVLQGAVFTVDGGRCVAAEQVLKVYAPNPADSKSPS